MISNVFVWGETGYYGLVLFGLVVSQQRNWGSWFYGSVQHMTTKDVFQGHLGSIWRERENGRTKEKISG